MKNQFEFNGSSPRVAKRRALNFWYTHRESLGLSVSEFFQCCRLRQQGGRSQIIYYESPR